MVNTDSTRCVHRGGASDTVFHSATAATRLCHIVGELCLKEESGAPVAIPLHDVKIVQRHTVTVHHNHNVTRRVSIRRQASSLDTIRPQKPEVVTELILNMILVCAFMDTVGSPTRMKTSCKDPGRHHPRTLRQPSSTSVGSDPAWIRRPATLIPSTLATWITAVPFVGDSVARPRPRSTAPKRVFF